MYMLFFLTIFLININKEMGNVLCLTHCGLVTQDGVIEFVHKRFS